MLQNNSQSERVLWPFKMNQTLSLEAEEAAGSSLCLIKPTVKSCRKLLNFVLSDYKIKYMKFYLF